MTTPKELLGTILTLIEQNKKNEAQNKRNDAEVKRLAAELGTQYRIRFKNNQKKFRVGETLVTLNRHVDSKNGDRYSVSITDVSEVESVE